MKLSTISSKGILLMLITTIIASQSSAIAADKIDLKKTSVTLDTNGFAKTMQREIEKAYAFDPEEQIILLSGQPECLRFKFDGVKVEGDNDFSKKHLLVFPLKAFEEVFAKDAIRSKRFKEEITSLKKVITQKSSRGVEDITVLPESDGAQMFHNQERFINFKNGSGVSFVTSYGNGDGPLTNDSQCYTFQGITKDGRFYVSFFAPVMTTGMPKAETQKPGVDYIGKLARNKFQPDLDSLDRVVKSLDIH